MGVIISKIKPRLSANPNAYRPVSQYRSMKNNNKRKFSILFLQERKKIASFCYKIKEGLITDGCVKVEQYTGQHVL